MPNFKEILDNQLSLDNELLESILGEIKNSSLYIIASRNIVKYNKNRLSYICEHFPKYFWRSTYKLYRKATDSLAVEFKKIRQPKQDSNYAKLSQKKQKADKLRYEEDVRNFKKETVVKWAVAYRQDNNLTPLPEEILSYYDQP